MRIQPLHIFIVIKGWLQKTPSLGILLFIALLSVGCGSTSSVEADLNKIQFLTKTVEEAHYEIISNWAFPLMTQGLNSLANSGLFMPGSNANSIDLMGNTNHLTVKGDSVSVSLPYFGERRMGGGYGNSDNGISFNGIPDTYSIEWDKKKNRYVVKMEVKQKTETLQFIITVFPSLKADINVNSTHRTSIRYSGNMRAISEE
ncbi:DUF4251 domain-containing protein [Muriicola sp.]|uniref:DUF4251 domain-containing protein n=1 Tax=Muriicola sp. TaxID=2020856 RepID=UPI003C70C882